MKKLIKFLFLFLLSISINQVGFSQQNCVDPFPFDVDLSSNTTHTIDDVLQQLGLTSLQDLCNLNTGFTMRLGGILTLDKPNQEICFSGTEIQMLEDAQIQILSNTTVTLDGAYVYGCDYMWNSISLSNATINVLNQSKIEDGKSGVFADDNSYVNLKNSFFINNMRGLSGVSSSSSSSVKISVSGCTFGTNGNYLGGVNDLLVGIYLLDLDYTNLSPLPNERNTFYNLDVGIWAWSTAIRINNSDFTSINGEGLFKGAINLHNDYGRSIGTSIINNNNFSNAQYGIVADKGNLYAMNNIMSCTNCIDIEETNIINIRINQITSSNIGINVKASEGYASHFIFAIYDNTIDMYSAPDGKAINIQSTDHISIYDNDISMYGGEAGIFIGNSNNVIIEENGIELFGGDGDEIEGIHLEACENIDISGNSLNHGEPAICCVPSNTGIYSDISYGLFSCNNISGYFSKGMQFYKDCAYSNLKDNTFNTSSKDLLLGNGNPQIETTIGVQGDDQNYIGWGNRWVGYTGGSAYNYSPDEIVSWSEFIVNSQVSQVYKPYTIVANGFNDWFFDEPFVANGGGTSSPCSLNSSNPPIGPSAFNCDSIIQKILQIDTLSIMNDCNKNIWKYHYFKKLLMMKKANLLNGSCLSFFNNMQSDVLVQIAKVDSAFSNILIDHSADSLLLDNITTVQTNLDNLFDQGYVFTPQWDTTMTLYNQLLDTQGVLMKVEQDSDNQEVDRLKKVIPTIQVRDTCLKVLLKTFDIALDYVKNDTLTPLQLNNIIEVSELCSYDFGDGVYLARSIRNNFENIRYTDLEDCASGALIPRSISQSKLSEGLIIYPNPAIDEVNISFISIDNDEAGEITIVDIEGRVISVLKTFKGENHYKIDTENYKPGLYLIKYLSKRGEQSIKKLMIAK